MDPGQLVQNRKVHDAAGVQHQNDRGIKAAQTAQVLHFPFREQIVAGLVFAVCPFSRGPAQYIQCSIAGRFGRRTGGSLKGRVDIRGKKVGLLAGFQLFPDAVPPFAAGLAIDGVTVLQPGFVGDLKAGGVQAVADGNGFPGVYISRSGPALQGVQGACAVEGNAAAGGQRKRVVFVFQKDDAFLRSPAGKGAVHFFVGAGGAIGAAGQVTNTWHGEYLRGKIRCGGQTEAGRCRRRPPAVNARQQAP